jgi:di/tricarboxylate transporter
MRILSLLIVVLAGLLMAAVPPPRATVYVFLAATCPISQAATLELRTLHERYAHAGVAFVGVFPDSTVTAADRMQFARDYQISFALRADDQHVLTRRFGATITPEVVVVSAAGQKVYQGRLNDEYLGLGQRRTLVQHHELADALASLVAGRPVAVAQVPAVGCLIENP